MKGLKAENRVASSLRRSGASVARSPGSRGSADNIAVWDNGKKWLTQVKYSGVSSPAGLSSREKQNLVSRAQRNNATPVLAQVTPKKIGFFSAKSGRRLVPHKQK
jgi:Holliday junction resolvase